MPRPTFAERVQFPVITTALLAIVACMFVRVIEQGRLEKIIEQSEREGRRWDIARSNSKTQESTKGEQ